VQRLRGAEPSREGTGGVGGLVSLPGKVWRRKLVDAYGRHQVRQIRLLSQHVQASLAWCALEKNLPTFLSFSLLYNTY
jgi:hypothetical protein